MSYQFLPGLFLRSPFYSYHDHDPARMPEVLGRQSFRNAIRLASEDFYLILEKKGFDHEKLNEKEKHTLAKYYNRMCFRPTPFGLFASFSVLDWEHAGQVRLAAEAATLLHLLPDQSRIPELNHLHAGDNSRLLRLNPALYALGKEYRFIRSLIDHAGRYRFSLDTLALLPFHTQLLSQFAQGPVNAQNLAEQIAADTACSLDEAADYVDFLAGAQVLYGPERGQIIRAAGQTDPFADLHRMMASQDELPTSGPFYAATERPLLSGKPDTGSREELLRAVKVLARLSPDLPQSDLAQFITAFSARYDRRKVPLLEALDPDAGITYGGLTAARGEAGLDGIPFGASTSNAGKGDWGAARQLLFRFWPRDGRSPLVISDSDLGDLPLPPMSKQPSTLAIIFRRAEGQLLIEHTGGATAAALSGRFSVFSEAASQLCREIAAEEQAAHPDILFADLGQFSDTHADNINRRDQIYPYEIPLNTYSALTPEAQLRPADLLLSVQGGELILESAGLGKRVIPRLATAYNFRKNDLALYRLLCDLQYQGLRSPQNLDIERLFPGLPYYPRVVHGRSILSLARWKLEGPETAALCIGQESLTELSARRGLPQRVSMGQEDQQLVFDLAESEEAAFFLRCLKSGEAVTLYEYLWPDRSVRSESGPLAAQFVAVLGHRERIYAPPAQPGPPVAAVRDFRPGSEWLYLKVYCTPATADMILARVIAPLTRRLKNQVQSWFFIRYSDSGYHLRLRFRTEPKHIGRILAALEKELRKGGYDQLVSDYQGGMYTRELERYGADIIEEVEMLFHAGSEMALSSALDPFGLAIATTEAIIAVFYDLPAAIAFTARISESFLAEFGGDKALRTGLDQKYREHKNDIDILLANSCPDAETLLGQLRAIRERSAAWPEARTATLLGDLVHMQLNRTFSTQSRRHELLVYYCLHKHLVSRSKRKEGASTQGFILP